MKNTILQNLLRSSLLVLMLVGCHDRTAPNYRSPQEVQYSKLPPAPPAQPPQPPAAPQYYYAQPYAPPTQAYQQPYQGRSQPYGYPPASRFYNNPYAFQPPAQYPYYDSDHYYVPPNYYGAEPGGGALSPNNHF